MVRTHLMVALAAVVGTIGLGQAVASPLSLTVETDQATYLPHELMTVTITAENPNAYDVILHYTNTHEAGYLVDGIDVFRYHAWSPIVYDFTIPAGGQHAWTFNHDSPLAEGMHSIVGYVCGGGMTDPIMVEVVPEPGALTLLAAGALAVIRRRRA